MFPLNTAITGQVGIGNENIQNIQNIKDTKGGGGLAFLDGVFGLIGQGTQLLSEVNKISENKNTRDALAFQKKRITYEDDDRRLEIGQNDNTLLYVGIGAGVLVLGGLVLYFATR